MKIISFKDSITRQIYNEDPPKRISSELVDQTFETMLMIDGSESFNDMRNPKSNHLEKLKGDRAGQWSIRVNKKYRLCFEFISPDTIKNLELVNYH